MQIFIAARINFKAMDDRGPPKIILVVMLNRIAVWNLPAQGFTTLSLALQSMASSNMSHVAFCLFIRRHDLLQDRWALKTSCLDDRSYDFYCHVCHDDYPFISNGIVLTFYYIWPLTATLMRVYKRFQIHCHFCHHAATLSHPIYLVLRPWATLKPTIWFSKHM